MIIPKLKKIKSEKRYHDILLNDEYAWVDQPDILEVLKDANKLNPEVKKSQPALPLDHCGGLHYDVFYCCNYYCSGILVDRQSYQEL